MNIMNGMMLYSLLGRGYLTTTEETPVGIPYVTEPSNVEFTRTNFIWPEDPDDELPIS